MDNQIQIPARVESHGLPVLTTEQLADFYGCSTSNIKMNFSNNKTRFIEGVHYFSVTGDELKKLRVNNIYLQISPMTRTIYLWTEQGAARHAKLLSTDNAWKVFNTLEAHYFKTKKIDDLDSNTMLALGNHIIGNPDVIIKICENWKADREKIALLEAEKELLNAENKALEENIAELAPKGAYYDAVLSCKDLIPTTPIAKDYGYTTVKFNKLLFTFCIQFRQGNSWALYDKYAKLGWAQTRTYIYTGSDGEKHSQMHLYWTQAGRVGIYEVLKKHGILPICEKQNCCVQGVLFE